MDCAACGVRNPPDSRFCMSCGQPLDASDTTASVPDAPGEVSSRRRPRSRSRRPPKSPAPATVGAGAGAGAAGGALRSRGSAPATAPRGAIALERAADPRPPGRNRPGRLRRHAGWFGVAGHGPCPAPTSRASQRRPAPTSRPAVRGPTTGRRRRPATSGRAAASHSCMACATSTGCPGSRVGPTAGRRSGATGGGWIGATVVPPGTIRSERPRCRGVPSR